jgi:hypothetical protein
MSLAAKLLSASGGGVDKLYVDDVFSAYTYTGNGSTQTINNGIDLAGKGGMVWIKERSNANPHIVTDTVRGGNQVLVTNTTDASSTGYTTVTPTSSGFSVPANSEVNGSPRTYASWTFARAPKFFDVVTYTGNGVAGRQIPHALGIAPGMMIVKTTSNAKNWAVWHRGANGGDSYANLNDTSAFAASGRAFFGTGPFGAYTAPTSTDFTVSPEDEVNKNGWTYVAYLFAHDTSADGLVKCGSFTTDGSGNATVNLGWEPQYLLTKASNAVSQWPILDTARGLPAPASNGGWAEQSFVNANTSGAEITGTGPYRIMSSGFATNGVVSSTTFIYLAIRRPNKPPTLGTQVYNAITRTGTGAAATVTGVGFAPDAAFIRDRSAATGYSFVVQDRLRGAGNELQTWNTSAEGTGLTACLSAFGMDGVSLGTDAPNHGYNVSPNPEINHFFKRAPGVFDEVCWTATSPGAVQRLSHSLGAAPELLISKSRADSFNWYVQTSALAGALNLTNSFFADTTLTPTATAFSIQPGTNYGTQVGYLFATKAGISRVGNYTGNGTSQTIDCGFTTGARFVMIKATSTTGDWLTGDSTRGLVAGNDPRLSLNTTAAEVTTEDWLDPHSSGFIVNNVAGSNANASGVSYIFLSFA